MEIIEFWIAPDGQEVRVEPKGYSGPRCTADTAPFERDLGITKMRKLKPEHNATAAVKQGGSNG